MTHAALQFNAAHQQWLADVIQLTMRPAQRRMLEARLAETRRRGEVWQVLWLAHCETVWLKSDFERLRRALGEEAFWRGELPFPIP